MAALSSNNWSGTTTATDTQYFTITSSTSTGTGYHPPDPEFPDWADEGRIVIDKDDNEWLVVGQYVNEDGECVLELENEEIGLEAEAKVEELEAEW